MMCSFWVYKDNCEIIYLSYQDNCVNRTKKFTRSHANVGVRERALSAHLFQRAAAACAYVRRKREAWFILWMDWQARLDQIKTAMRKSGAYNILKIYLIYFILFYLFLL